MRLPKMYQEITLQDGRKCTVIDYMGDIIIADTRDDCVYYTYGYNSEKKSADALYRFKEGKFERFFPREGIWMELPEQRMILKESKPRYEIVSEETAMCLALLV